MPFAINQNLAANRLSRPINRPVRPISLVVGLCLSISTFFFDFSIAGFGLGLLPFGLLGLYSAFLIYYHTPIPPKNNAIKHVFIAHVIFSSTTFLAFLINGSMALHDIRYLIANASNVFWWPILYIIFCYRVNIISDSFRIGYTILSYAVILSWIFLYIHTGDFLFLRHEYLHLPFVVFEVSVFRNPNMFCRIVIIAITIMFYLYIQDGINRGKNNRLSLIPICMLIFIVLTSLSRANIFTLLLLGFGFLSIDDSFKLRSSRQLRAICTLILLVPTIFLLMPEVLERFEKGAEMLSYFYSVISAKSGYGIDTLRVRTWIATLNIIRDNPLYGVGFTAIEDLLQRYGSVTLGGKLIGEVILVHGGFLKILAYGGFLSLFPFLVLYSLIFWKSLKMTFVSKQKWKRGSAYLCCLLLLLLIPINIGADCFGLSFTWMSIAYLFVLGQLNSNRVRYMDPNVVRYRPLINRIGSYSCRMDEF